ncbi:MAG: RAD55 family ATPase [Thermoplasmata archaeon]
MIDFFPSNSSALLLGPPGVGKFEFSIDYVVDILQNKGRIVFVAVDLHPVEIRRWIMRYGADVPKCEGKNFLFVDCYSHSVDDSQNLYEDTKTLKVNSLSNIESIGMNISKAAERLGKPVRIVFYTLSTLFLYNPPQAMAKFFQMISSRVKTEYGFILYVLHEGVHDDRTVRLLESLVDGVVQMRFDDDLRREWRIHHYRGKRYDPHWVRFDVNKYAFVTAVDEKRLVNEFLDYEYGHNPQKKMKGKGADHIMVEADALG